jgi:hypothetical protein
MSPLLDIIRKRKAGRVRLNLASYRDEPIPEILSRFGLGCDRSPNPILREVSRAEARQILVSLLAQDMAYHADVMPLSEAESLVDHFLSAFPPEHAKFVTNLGRPDNSDRHFDVASSPMTQSTFDGGVICLASPIVGCLWVEDED